jgi:hypothetical protein
MFVLVDVSDERIASIFSTVISAATASKLMEIDVTQVLEFNSKYHHLLYKFSCRQLRLLLSRITFRSCVIE